MSTQEPPDVVDRIVAAWRAELPDVAGLPLELSKRIGRLAGLLDAVTVAELDRLGLTRAEYEVLARLRSSGAPYRRKPHELAQSLLLSSGGTTNVLNRLAATGLVTREADPADRRSSWVQLTPTGAQRAEAAVRAATAAQAALLDRLPETTGRALADLLRQVLTTVDDASRPRARRTSPAG